MNKIPIVVAESVRDYVRLLPPELRRRCKAALLALPDGDTRQLEGAYAGYFRLRVGSLRFVYRCNDKRLEVFYVEQRRLIYDLLAAHIRQLFNEE